MNRHPRRIGASGLLLTETLIAILFFSVAGAICLQLFVKAYTITGRTEALELSVSQGSSIVSLLEQMPANPSVSDFDPGDSAQLLQSACDAIRDVYPETVLTDDSVLTCFDDNGEHCAASDEHYTYRIAVTCDEKENKQTDGHACLLYRIVVTDLTAENAEDAVLQTYTAAVCRPYEKEASAYE